MFQENATIVFGVGRATSSEDGLVGMVMSEVTKIQL